MQGYNGSQLWDTTFAVQAICATGLGSEFTGCLRKAQHYVDVTQASALNYTTVPAGRVTPWQWRADSAKLLKRVRRLQFCCKQVRDDCPGPLVAWYRHISKGAWPFSTRDHGWPISDCSSEGLKVLPCQTGVLSHTSWPLATRCASEACHTCAAVKSGCSRPS